LSRAKRLASADAQEGMFYHDQNLNPWLTTYHSGKSSFVLTLLRLLELQSGSIHVDGVDLATVPRQYIRSHFTTIPQDPVKITGTIRNNLDPEGRIQSDDVLIAVLEKTSLWSLVSARGGLDADASEVGLSVGQQQLFCLARSLLSRNKLVLLDEATSSVDRTTDEEIRRIVREEMDGCTVIEVAHRLDVVKDFDLVIVMSEGVAIEIGNPNDLLSGPTAFRTLWEHQGL
jgi:ATP-binding cassette, subfamily C (CFTR/MRP), member 1